MKGSIVGLKTFTLPVGATNGQRIVLDGVNGEIDVYDSGNNLVAVISPTGIEIRDPVTGAEIQLLPANPAEINFTPAQPSGHTAGGGAVQPLISGAGAAAIPELVLEAPVIDALQTAIVTLAGQSADLTAAAAPSIAFTSSGSAPLDMLLNAVSLGRGFVVGIAKTTDTAALAAETVTHTFASKTYKNGRVYRLTLAGRAGVPTGGCTAMSIHLRKGNTTAGTLYYDLGFFTVNSFFTGGNIHFANNTGADIATALSLCAAPNVGTCVWQGSGTSPSGGTIEDAGSYAQWSAAPVALIT